jgi:hypothetical protein
MGRTNTAVIWTALLAAGWIVLEASGLSVAQTEQAPAGATTVPKPPETPSSRDAETETEQPSDTANEDTAMDGEDDVSIGDIPVIETVELELESTKKALDAFILVKEKYEDSGIENYEDLQDFVDKTEAGKTFEADLKAAGFANVDAWNLVITSASVAYSNELDDQTEETRQQIEEIKQDSELAQDLRDRWIKSLEAMIPSDKNRKVMADLMADPVYMERVKILEIEEE